MQILSPQLVNEAIDLVRPFIESVFENPRCTWGPKLVAIVVDAPSFPEPVVTWVGDRGQAWQSEWNEQDRFATIALWKAATARRFGLATSQLVRDFPTLLGDGDFLYPGGVSDGTGTIGIGTSGVKGRADEMISYAVLAAIEGMAHLRVEHLLENGVSQL